MVQLLAMELPVWFSPVLIFAAFALYAVVHSALATLGFKDRMRRLLGELVYARFYRLAYNIFAGVSLLPIFALVPLLPDRVLYTIPFPWTLLALAGQAAGVLILLVALAQTGAFEFLGLSQLYIRDEKPQPRLITSGLYARIRHPLYLAGLLFIWCSPLMSLNLLALNLSMSLYLLLGALYEERKLVAVFGEEYRRYRARTPMLLPLPKRE